MSNVSTVLKAETHDEDFNTGLEDSYRADISSALSDILADTYKLTIKSHLYHWNVVGPLFKPLHELTEEHYEALFAATDVIAERIRAVGHLAPIELGAAKNFAPAASDIADATAIDMVKDLIKDHESAVRTMRDAAAKAGDADDVVTEDMLTARLTFHEKAIWMLKAIIAN